MDQEQLAKVRNGDGFIAALDQSGGSTPKALMLYGVGEEAYSNDEEMFDRIHEMRSCTTGHPAADRPIIDQDNISTFARREVSSTYPGNSSADDADIGCEIFRQGRGTKRLGSSFPERNIFPDAFSWIFFRGHIPLWLRNEAGQQLYRIGSFFAVLPNSKQRCSGSNDIDAFSQWADCDLFCGPFTRRMSMMSR